MRMYVRCLGVMVQLMRDLAVRGSVHAKTTLLLDVFTAVGQECDN